MTQASAVHTTKTQLKQGVPPPYPSIEAVIFCVYMRSTMDMYQPN